MRKLRLASEDLNVETFAAGAAEGSAGTVHGQGDLGARFATHLPDCNPDVTTVFTGACIRNCHP
jgi:hypothetical protein